MEKRQYRWLCYHWQSMERARNKAANAFSDYFKEVIYGGVDGIVTTFAVVAGFAGASLSSDQTIQLSFAVVLLFGLANLFADATSMGLGNFLSVRSEKDLYKTKRMVQQHELQTLAVEEYGDTVTILMAEGFGEVDAKELAKIYQRNEEYWLDFMMHYEHKMPDPRSEREVLTGLATFSSFMVFGSIPLLPFMLQISGDAQTTFIYSIMGTFVALILLGIMKWKAVGTRLGASLFEVLLVGGTAAGLAYFVGTFFA